MFLIVDSDSSEPSDSIPADAAVSESATSIQQPLADSSTETTAKKEMHFLDQSAAKSTKDTPTKSINECNSAAQEFCVGAVVRVERLEACDYLIPGAYFVKNIGEYLKKVCQKSVSETRKRMMVFLCLSQVLDDNTVQMRYNGYVMAVAENCYLHKFAKQPHVTYVRLSVHDGDGDDIIDLPLVLPKQNDLAHCQSLSTPHVAGRQILCKSEWVQRDHTYGFPFDCDGDQEPAQKSISTKSVLITAVQPKDVTDIVVKQNAQTTEKINMVSSNLTIAPTHTHRLVKNKPKLPEKSKESTSPCMSKSATLMVKSIIPTRKFTEKVMSNTIKLPNVTDKQEVSEAQSIISADTQPVKALTPIHLNKDHDACPPRIFTIKSKDLAINDSSAIREFKDKKIIFIGSILDHQSSLSQQNPIALKETVASLGLPSVFKSSGLSEDKDTSLLSATKLSSNLTNQKCTNNKNRNSDLRPMVIEQTHSSDTVKIKDKNNLIAHVGPITVKRTVKTLASPRVSETFGFSDDEVATLPSVTKLSQDSTNQEQECTSDNNQRSDERSVSLDKQKNQSSDSVEDNNENNLAEHPTMVEATKDASTPKHKKGTLEQFFSMSSKKKAPRRKSESSSTNAEIDTNQVNHSKTELSNDIDKNDVKSVFSKAHQKESKRKRGIACGSCDSCTRVNCKTCIYCQDMKKYGGQGRLKQRCIRKKCPNIKSIKVKPETTGDTLLSPIPHQTKLTAFPRDATISLSHKTVKVDRKSLIRKELLATTENSTKSPLQKAEKVKRRSLIKKNVEETTESPLSFSWVNSKVAYEALIKREASLVRLMPNCGLCGMCKDKTQFGGPNKKKQMCSVKKNALKQRLARLEQKQQEETESSDCSPEKLVNRSSGRRRKLTQKMEESQTQAWRGKLQITCLRMFLFRL